MQETEATMITSSRSSSARVAAGLEIRDDGKPFAALGLFGPGRAMRGEERHRPALGQHAFQGLERGGGAERGTGVVGGLRGFGEVTGFAGHVCSGLRSSR